MSLSTGEIRSWSRPDPWPEPGTEIRDRYIRPAAVSLANAADVFAMNAIYRDLWATAGVLPAVAAAPAPIVLAPVSVGLGIFGGLMAWRMERIKAVARRERGIKIG